jgi:dolichol-phosphate mannosyltransferase
MSGLQISTKSSAVLLDGDLQDPPELIEEFIQKWRAGYDIVYGRRIKRDASLFMQISYKIFYRLFDYFSYIRIPHDAGDFSLLDRRVIEEILLFPERDLFLRGVRAFVGFQHTGVDYVRPKRLFGTSTNSLLKNIGWAKKGIFSFSNTPLNALSFGGTICFLISSLLIGIQVLGKLLFPGLTPPGLTTTIVIVIFFGSLNVLAIAVVGEYVAKIFEEVKGRPRFIRKCLVRNGITTEYARTQRQ